MKLSTLALLLVPASLAAQNAPAGPPTDPITTSFRTRIAGFYRNLPQAFDSIPADKFGFKPTAAQQTVGYVAQHLATDNYFFCNLFGDKKAMRTPEETSTPDSVKATWPKAKLVAQLKESVAFCQDAFTQLNDARLPETISYSFGGGPTRTAPRAAMVLGHAIDLADHYSQIANYMRLNGLLPPTALPRPRP